MAKIVLLLPAISRTATNPFLEQFLSPISRESLACMDQNAINVHPTFEVSDGAKLSVLDSCTHTLLPIHRCTS
jgi:hypothetical protein